MGRLKQGLERFVNSGKNIGKSIKQHAKVGLTTLALPLIINNNIEASTGKINVYNRIDLPYTNCRCLVFHYPGAIEGYEGPYGFDGNYWPMFNPSGIASKLVSKVDGIELETDARPVDSTSTISLPLSLISQSGDPVTISSENWLNVGLESIDGTGPFENEDVFITINGQTYNIRETSIINLPRLEGTYTSGGVYNTATVSFVPQAEPKHTPNVETRSISSISQTSATLEGKITDDGGEPDSYGFTYWKSGDPNSPTNWNCCKTTGATFSDYISGLDPNTTYFFKAQAKNSKGTGQGSANSFKTGGQIIPPINPTADTLYILNKITGFYGDENQKWTLKFTDGATEQKDKDDVAYTHPTNVSKNSKLISLVWQGRTKYQMKVDARPQDTNDISLQASVESSNGTPVHFDNAQNELGVTSRPLPRFAVL